MYEFAVPFVVSIQRLKTMIIFSIYLCLGGMIKMKKYIKYVIIIVIIILIAIAIYFFSRKNETEDSQVIEYTPQEGVEIDKNQVAYQENVTVDALKADVGATGDDSIYDVTSEYDGRKILTIKPEVQFNVVLAGIIENQMPEGRPENLRQYDEDFQDKTGIWVAGNSQEAFLELLHNTTQNTYSINSDGYLVCENTTNGNEIDEKIQNVLNGEDLYIISMTGTCYVADEVSGEIVEYPFEQMDPYQTCEHYEKDNKKVFVVTTNARNELSNEEIITSIFIDK